MQHRLRKSASLGVTRAPKVDAAISPHTYWTHLISAVINSTNLKDVVLTFSRSFPITIAANWTVAGGNTVNSVARSEDGKTITLTCANNVATGTTVTFNKGTGLTTVAIVKLIRETDIVEAGGRIAISTGAGNIAGINPGRSIITINNYGLIRQKGTITKVVLRIGAGVLPTLFTIDLWRKDGTTWDRISQSANLASSLVNETTVELTVSIPAQAGDYLAINSNSCGNVYVGVSGHTAGSLRYQTETSVSATDFDWTAQSALAYVLPLKSYQRAPMIIGIGDSIMAGHTANYSGLEGSFVNVPANSITGQLELLSAAYVSQNMGIGSQTTTNIKDRFTADVINLKPKIAIINGGVNDIAGGVISQETFIANYTTMLDACVAAGIIPVVCKILPWTAGSNAQMQTRDTWMAALQALLTASYPSAIWVDFDSTIGMFRAGGDAGNLWNIKTDPDYNDDNVHLTLIGYAEMARVINLAIAAKYTLAV